MAQLVNLLTLGFGSWFVGLSPRSDSLLMVQNLVGTLSPSLSAPPLLVFALSQEINKLKKIKKKIKQVLNSSLKEACAVV